MKRICYLITFFLTSFSIAANEPTLQNAFLITEAGRTVSLELETAVACEETNPEASSERTLLPAGFLQNHDLVCLKK